MSEVTLIIDGVPRRVPGDISVAAAMLSTGVLAFRTSTQGKPRAPLCGMGTCQECRVTIDGQVGVRACIVTVAEGMIVETTA